MKGEVVVEACWFALRVGIVGGNIVPYSQQLNENMNTEETKAWFIRCFPAFRGVGYWSV